jgi:hypothetical protein
VLRQKRRRNNKKMEKKTTGHIGNHGDGRLPMAPMKLVHKYVTVTNNPV